MRRSIISSANKSPLSFPGRFSHPHLYAQSARFQSAQVLPPNQGAAPPLNSSASLYLCPSTPNQSILLFFINPPPQRCGTPSELLASLYLCTNRVSPAHEGVELGIGDATLIKALGEATGRKEANIKVGGGWFSRVSVLFYLM